MKGDNVLAARLFAGEHFSRNRHMFLHGWRGFPTVFLVRYVWASVRGRGREAQLNNHIRGRSLLSLHLLDVQEPKLCAHVCDEAHGSSPYLRSFHTNRKTRNIIRKTTEPEIKTNFGKSVFSWHESKAKHNGPVSFQHNPTWGSTHLPPPWFPLCMSVVCLSVYLSFYTPISI